MPVEALFVCKRCSFDITPPCRVNSPVAAKELKEFVLIWYGKFHYFTINALNLYDNFGEKRIKFRILVFVLLAFEEPGSMSANF